MSVASLAILGGPPQFETPRHVGRPNVLDPEGFQRRIREALDRNWFTNNGPLVREFEQVLADYLGVKHCIAVANATLGLELTLRSLELRGEVIVPAFTFAATVEAILHCGLRPVFCDVDRETHQLDATEAAKLISPNTSAIVGVHLWGHTCDVESLSALAKAHELSLIFDAAHAFACTRGPTPVGQFGDAEVFSFHATKFIQSAEGGVITTNRDDLADDLRLRRNFGFSGMDRIEQVGTNAKLSELHAAMGLSSFGTLEAILELNRERYRCYQEALRDIPGLTLMQPTTCGRSNHQYVVVSIDRDQFDLSRDLLVQALWAENVLARRYFAPGCHRIPAFQGGQAAASKLPFTDQLCETVFQLPTGTGVTPQDIAEVGRLLRQIASDAARIQARSTDHTH